MDHYATAFLWMPDYTLFMYFGPLKSTKRTHLVFYIQNIVWYGSFDVGILCVVKAHMFTVSS